MHLSPPDMVEIKLRWRDSCDELRFFFSCISGSVLLRELKKLDDKALLLEVCVVV